jgi:hypothetical protein
MEKSWADYPSASDYSHAGRIFGVCVCVFDGSIYPQILIILLDTLAVLVCVIESSRVLFGREDHSKMEKADITKSSWV